MANTPLFLAPEAQPEQPTTLPRPPASCAPFIAPDIEQDREYDTEPEDHDDQTPMPRRPRYARTPDQIAERTAFLDKTGRRCDGNSRRCLHNAATRRVTVRDIDPATGQPTGEPYDVQSCSQHMKQWTRATGRYQVIQTAQLPAFFDPRYQPKDRPTG